EEQKFIMDKIYEDQIRVEDLTKKIERLYDDWLANKISESNFQKILEKSQNEQDYLNQRIKDNQKLIVKEDLEDINVKKWIELIKKHRDIKKLDKATLNELISKIYVHEKEVVNGEITQTIDIYYNFIGNTDT
ncbi:recombinase RecB, partial [Aerococcus sanguinicola]